MQVGGAGAAAPRVASAAAWLTDGAPGVPAGRISTSASTITAAAAMPETIPGS